MNRALDHFCAHTGKIGPGSPLEDGEMREMTLPSKHRIRNLNPGDLRPSTLHLCLNKDGRNQYHKEGNVLYIVSLKHRLTLEII